MERRRLMRIEDAFNRYRLWRELRFVGGVLTGIGIGGGLGYAVGWEHELGLQPGLNMFPCLLLLVVGQEIAVRAVRRSREMGEDQPRNA
jgi:hypothetical protein